MFQPLNEFLLEGGTFFTALVWQAQPHTEGLTSGEFTTYLGITLIPNQKYFCLQL
jgi:hypothetical protein